MSKIVQLAMALFVLFGANSAFAVSPSELVGRWVVTWPNNSKNNIKLTFGGGAFSGIYVNDAGVLCPMSGTMAGGSVNFTVTCPKWDIKMNGAASGSGTISGSYVAYGKATGSFSMVKQAEPGQPAAANRNCVDARQTDGSVWSTCVGDDGRNYCEQCKAGACSRVACR